MCHLIYAIWSAINDAVWNHKVPMVKMVVHNVIDASEIKLKFQESLRAVIA